MSSTFGEISVSKIESDGFAYFAVYIDDENVVVSDEGKYSLRVYNTCSKKWIHTHKCDSTPYGICHAYSMNRINVAFGHVVIKYEIKNRGIEFIELEKIQVEGVVQGIAKTIEGFFTANESSVSFRWSDFTIKFNLPYVKSGDRPFICSSFCGKKVAYTTERSVIIMDTKGNRLSEYSCSRSKPRGLSFDSGDNIIVCFSESRPEQIKFDEASRRRLKMCDSKQFPDNIIFHPEGHRCISLRVRKFFSMTDFEMRAFEIRK